MNTTKPEGERLKAPFRLNASALISCSVFDDELKTILADDEYKVRETVRLPMGLHDRPDELRSVLQRTIGELEQYPDVEFIILVYALCGNGIVGLKTERCTLVVPRADDCIGVLMGGHLRHRAYMQQNPATYFYSPGWIRERRVPGPDRADWLRKEYADRYDDEMLDEIIEADEDNFAHHNCAAWLDITNNTKGADYCRQCASHQGWAFKHLPADPSLLRDLLAGNWDDARFLLVQPGAVIASDPQNVIRAEPQ